MKISCMHPGRNPRGGIRDKELPRVDHREGNQGEWIRENWNHGEGMLKQESWLEDPGERILKRTPERRTQGGILEEESWGGKQEESSRRIPEEGTLKKESWKMNHQGGLLEEYSQRRIPWRGNLREKILDEEPMRRNP